MLPPKSRFAGVPQVHGLAPVLPFGFGRGRRDPVRGDEGAVEDHVGVATGVPVGQDLVQVGGLGGEGGDGFVQVAVGGGDADPVVGGQPVYRGGVAEPAQDQDRVPVGGQCSSASARATTSAFGSQDAGNEPDQLVRHVERGTIIDHVGPLDPRT
jgi:hypothetical protein